MIIPKTDKIICKSIFENVEVFNGDFLFHNQKASVSKQLVQLIEPPFPVKIGLLIQSTTKKKKTMINKLANDGLSINYQRVMEIQEDITQYLCTKYNREALVCPPQLKQGLFTITSINNIDHIPSSATASSSFHGTTISIFQKVTSKRCKDITLKLNTDINQEIFKTLPVYNNIFLVKGGEPKYPINSKNSSLFSHGANYSLDSAKARLDKFTQKITKYDNSETQDISLPSFYSNLLKSNLNQLDKKPYYQFQLNR